MSGGKPADDGVACPAQRGDAEQEVGLVGDPTAYGCGAAGLVGCGGHVGSGAEEWDAIQRHAFSCAINGQDALRSCRVFVRSNGTEVSARLPRCERASRALAASGAAMQLAPHQLLGEFNQQTLGSNIP